MHGSGDYYIYWNNSEKNKYAKFKYIVPDVTWYLGSREPEVNFRGDETINKNEMNFCLNFIIESALRY